MKWKHYSLGRKIHGPQRHDILEQYVCPINSIGEENLTDNASLNMKCYDYTESEGYMLRKFVLLRGSYSLSHCNLLNYT